MIKILFFGDIVGKLGRRAVGQILSSLKKKHEATIVIGNVENLAHGKSITRTTLEELLQSGVDFCTSGNHIWAKPDAYEMLEDKSIPVLRPANYPPTVGGDGHRLIDVGGYKFLVINLIGRVFMPMHYDDPFQVVDKILKEYEGVDRAATFIDFHAEATSEKVCLGLYLDGRVSAVVGTHTHVPTADAEIFPGGTAYLTDAGMSGGQGTSLGVIKDDPIRGFLTSQPQAWDYPENGPCWVNGVCITIDPATQKATHIETIRELVHVA